MEKVVGSSPIGSTILRSTVRGGGYGWQAIGDLPHYWQWGDEGLETAARRFSVYSSISVCVTG
jgi:hypothetical protein